MKPLSVPMAVMLRRLLAEGDALRPQHAGVLFGLVGRKLAVPVRDSARLTARGRVIARTLGHVPTDPWGKADSDSRFCRMCDLYVPVELIAWDEEDGGGHPPCINCIMERRGL